jgi:hypothetical protein
MEFDFEPRMNTDKHGFRKAEKVFLGGASVLTSRSGHGFFGSPEVSPHHHPCPSVSIRGLIL